LAIPYPAILDRHLIQRSEKPRTGRSATYGSILTGYFRISMP